jgi:hypothetical protein
MLGTIGLVASLGGAVALAQSSDEPQTDINLETLDCRTMLSMKSEDRDFTLVFYHGIVSGRHNKLIFKGDVLAGATDRILNHCIDNPDEKLLGVFEQVRKD